MPVDAKAGWPYTPTNPARFLKRTLGGFRHAIVDDRGT